MKRKKFTLEKVVVTGYASEGKSLAKVDGKVTVIPAAPGERIDTTGAGDIYASGFLYGLINNYPVEQCGALASRLGAACIQTIGARLSDEHFN